MKNSMTDKLLRLPHKFFDDHGDRALPTPDIVRATASHYFIRADDPAVESLLDDARYYTDPYGPDAEWLGGLKASARATIKAIEAARLDLRQGH
jgi:hypothetical protein